MRVSFLDPIFFHLNNLYCSLSGVLSPFIKLSPLVLRIRITTKCNLSCPFCYLKSGLNREEKNNLTLKEWDMIFSKLPRRTIIDLTGAEPLMSKDTKGFIEILSKRKLRYSMTTNGTVYNGLTAKEIVQNKMYVLMISLDGVDEVHDKLRGKVGAFQRTIDFINEIEKEKKKQKSKYPFINIKTTVLDENVHNLENLMNKLGDSIPCDTLTLSLLFQNRARGGMELFDDFNSSELQEGNTAQYLNKNEIKKFFSNIFSTKYRFNISIRPRMKLNDINKYIDQPSSMYVKSCPQFKNTITLNFDGKVSPCDISLNLGNIRDHNYNFSEIYRGIKFKRFINIFKSGEPICEGCCSGKHIQKSN